MACSIPCPCNRKTYSRQLVPHLETHCIGSAQRALWIVGVELLELKVALPQMLGFRVEGLGFV